MSNPLTSGLKSLIDGHLEDTGGLLRRSPTWVPCSFLQPGLLIEFRPDALALGANKHA